MLVRRRVRPGYSSLETVICAGALMPIAAALYWMLEQGVESFFFILSNSVPTPLF